MGCAASSSRAVTPEYIVPDFTKETKHFIESHRRNSHCTQNTSKTSLNIDDESGHGNKKYPMGSGKTAVTDTSMDWERLDTIESQKIMVQKAVSPLALNLKAKKYRSPYVLEDDISVYDTSCTSSEVAVQEDSWYKKPRPTLKIEVHR